MSRHRREEGRRRSERTAHLTDYLAVFRNHFWLSLFTASVVFCAIVAKTLYQPPVYRSEAVVQIDTQNPTASLLGEIAAMESASTTDAEMEVMRSYRVAEGAAKLLRPGDLLIEENAYRPFEVLVRSLRGAPLPRCRLTVDTPPVSRGGGGDTFVFEFSKDAAGGLGLRVGDEGEDGKVAWEPVAGFRSGEPFRVLGRSFTVTVEGDPTGRRFLLPVRPLQQTALWIQDNVVVTEVGRRTGIVNIGFHAESPDVARVVADALAQSYLAYKQEVKETQAEKAISFLADEISRVKGKLSDAEVELDRFRTESGAALLSDRARVIVAKVSELDLQKAEVEVDLETQRQLLRGLGTESGLSSALLALDSARTDPMTAALAQELARLEMQQEKALRGDVTEKHPAVQELRAEIEASRERLRKNLRTVLEGRVQGLERRLEGVAQAIVRYEADARSLPQTERRIAELTRDVEANLQIYSYLEEKQQEAQIARASTLAAMRLVDRALAPSTRLSPNLFKQTIIAALFAAIAALAVAFFAEYLDRSIKSPQELEEGLGIPLYAALPAFRSVRSKTLRKLKTALVTIEKPNSMLAENYRTLRANIRFANLERPLRTMAITSSVLGEGKTVTTLNLAVVLAQGGSRVIVVDCDLRRPATHSHLGHPLAPGLSDVLQGKVPWREALRKSPVENLDLLHSGKKPANPGSMLDSPAFSRLMEELKAEYEYVLFDVPPVLAVSDSASFFRRLDGVFLLARYKVCAIEVVQGARDQVQRLGANLVGVIYNGFDARKAFRKGYGYYGYYGYYGRYGKYGGYGYGEDRPRTDPSKEEGAESGRAAAATRGSGDGS